MADRRAFQEKAFEQFLKAVEQTVIYHKGNAKEVKAKIEKIRKNPPWKNPKSKITEGNAFKTHAVKGKELTWQAKKAIIDSVAGNKEFALIVYSKVLTPQEKRTMQKKLAINQAQFQKAEDMIAAKQKEKKIEKIKQTKKILKKGKKFGKKLTSLHRF